MGKSSAVIRLGYVHLRVTDLEEAIGRIGTFLTTYRQE